MESANWIMWACRCITEGGKCTVQCPYRIDKPGEPKCDQNRIDRDAAALVERLSK